MKKNILVSTAAILVGVLVEKQFGVADKAKEFGKNAWNILKKKTKEYKEKIDENLEELKEEAETE